MVNVKLPIQSQLMADKIRDVMLQKYKTYIFIFDLAWFNKNDGKSKWYVRFSCCIYNELSDYTTAAE